MMINRDHCFSSIPPDTDIEELGEAHNLKLQRDHLDSHKPASINNMTAVLSTTLHKAHVLNIRHKDVPILSRLPTGKRKNHYYQDVEINALINSAYEIDKGEILLKVILFQKFSAARIGETLGMDWARSVDFNRQEITFFNTKNGDDRTIPMDGDLLKLMQSMYEHRLNDGAVFPISYQTLRRRLKKLQSVVGMDHDRLWHTFRHTACSSLWEKGADLPTVMAIMGHRKPQTSMLYSHAKRENIRRAMLTL